MQIAGLSVLELVILPLVGVLYIAIVGVPAALICRRIGRPAWLAVFALIPVANVGLLWYVAVAPWRKPAPDPI